MWQSVPNLRLKKTNVENSTTSPAGVMLGYLDRYENGENKDPYSEEIARFAYNTMADAKEKKRWEQLNASSDSGTLS